MTETCPLCWYQFDTEDELAQHEQMEASLTYEVEVTTPQPRPTRSDWRA